MKENHTAYPPVTLFLTDNFCINESQILPSYIRYSVFYQSAFPDRASFFHLHLFLQNAPLHMFLLELLLLQCFRCPMLKIVKPHRKLQPLPNGLLYCLPDTQLHDHHEDIPAFLPQYVPCTSRYLHFSHNRVHTDVYLLSLPQPLCRLRMELHRLYSLQQTRRLHSAPE